MKVNLKRALYLGGISAAVSVAAISYAVRAPSSQIFAPSVYRGVGRRRSVALTFDDGPSPGTAALLNLLQRAGVRATFFQCGMNVLRYPDLARSVAEAGHEIGNHTFSHPRLCPRLGRNPNFVSTAEVLQEFELAQEIILNMTGVAPRWLRAPYGMRWFGVRAAQKRLGLKGAYWTAIGHDWEWSAGRVAEHVLRHVAPGGIICLHDGRDTQAAPDISSTLRAVPLIVSRLRALGYRFETVSEIVRT